MALKSSREGLRKELVDYLGNIIVDDNLRNEIIKAVGDKFVTTEVLNENVNNLTTQITTESGERIEADTTLQNNITAEATAREEADITLQNNINAETTARQEAISSLQELIGNSGLRIDLLWTNASSTSGFVAQTINLDLNNYKCVLVYGKRTVSEDTCYTGITIVNSSGVLLEPGTDLLLYRRYTTSNNSISFELGRYVGSDLASEDWAIPISIYGIK